MTGTQPHPGNVRDLIRERWGVNVTPVFQRGTTLIGGAVATIFKNDPNRIALWLCNSGGQDVFVTPDPAHIAAFGTIRVSANGGVLTAQYDEDGEVVAYEWQAVTSGTNTNLFLVEMLLQATVPRRAGL